MDRFIPRDKLSKRARKALDSKKRITWEQNPVTRRVESKKTYNRKKDLRWQDTWPGDLSFMRVLHPFRVLPVPALPAARVPERLHSTRMPAARLHP